MPTFPKTFIRADKNKETEMPEAVDLWFASFADFDGCDAAKTGADLLDDEERRRRDRFLFTRDRDSFALSHGLLRLVLSSYSKTNPAAWTYAWNDWGKPRIVEPAAEASLRFNLSHTRGGALIGVSRSLEVGVDIEATQRETSCLDLADRYFSPSEVAALRQLPDSRQRERFFELWTLKESYIKARGMGLAIPLDQFSFAFPKEYDPAGEVVPAISFTPPLDDQPEEWQFVGRPVGATFRTAAAVRCRRDQQLRMIWRRLRPGPVSEAELLA
ncbi:MAG: 4-phosphopantetheinyl transferase [Pirellula sp.]|nr:4-phosphopantetheinyl transferase [Pirellula sp.]